MPNIILTTFQPKMKNNKENGGNYQVFEYFQSQKKRKAIQKDKELNKEEASKEKLNTLEEKLKEENIIVNDKDSNKDTEKPYENNENIKNNNKYNFVLGVINLKRMV